MVFSPYSFLLKRRISEGSCGARVPSDTVMGATSMRISSLTATFDNERLDAMLVEVVHQLR